MYSARNHVQQTDAGDSSSLRIYEKSSVLKKLSILVFMTLLSRLCSLPMSQDLPEYCE